MGPVCNCANLQPPVRGAEALAVTMGIVAAVAPVLPTIIQLLQVLLAHHKATESASSIDRRKHENLDHHD